MLEINTNPSKSDLKWFGLIFGAVLMVVGLVLWLKTSVLFGMGSSPTIASKVVWALAVLFPIVYYAIPPARKPLFVGFMYAAFPIGWVASNVILVVVYYVVMTPIGLVMRLAGKDPMQRELLPESPTYWEERPSEDDALRYFKQF